MNDNFALNVITIQQNFRKQMYTLLCENINETEVIWTYLTTPISLNILQIPSLYSIGRKR